VEFPICIITPATPSDADDHHPVHAQQTGHGDGDHAQSGVHGQVVRDQLPRLDPAACLDLMPGCETPGFDWASANAVKVWHALFDHARRLGVPQTPSSTELGGDNQEPCLYCIWAVDLMARLLDMSRNTVGSALKELVDMGWIKKSTLRNKGGVFSGQEVRGGQRESGAVAENEPRLPPDARRGRAASRSV